jgi:hypothetical protein
MICSKVGQWKSFIIHSHKCSGGGGGGGGGRSDIFSKIPGRRGGSYAFRTKSQWEYIILCFIEFLRKNVERERGGGPMPLFDLILHKSKIIYTCWNSFDDNRIPVFERKFKFCDNVSSCKTGHSLTLDFENDVVFTKHFS